MNLPRPLKQRYHIWRSWKNRQEHMTLCIGALAMNPGPPGSKCIVLCFDSMVSDEEFGSETEYKFRRLSHQLVALFADRPGRAKELALIYERHLKTVELTEDNVLEHLRGPLDELKRRIAESYIRRRLAISYDDLIKHGDEWVGADRKTKYLDDIDAHQLKVGLIIAGFIGETPVLCELHDGDLEWRTNFSMIGIGAYTAEPAMHAREHTFNTLREDAVYNTYEAKRFGESSPYVGRETIMYVLYPADKGSKGHIRAERVTPLGFKFLAKQFRKFGPRPIKKWQAFPKGTTETAFFNFKEGY